MDSCVSYGMLWVVSPLLTAAACFWMAGPAASASRGQALFMSSRCLSVPGFALPHDHVIPAHLPQPRLDSLD
jgi:hypothetical protein